jgi:NADPH:quinone reductase-like Zn-dependent oxidoreductase
MNSPVNLKPIVVYLIEHHPLEISESGPVFQWLHFNNKYQRQLKAWLGPHDPETVSFLIDDTPSRNGWSQLIDGLKQGQIKSVVTHLAPLTDAQRHQLIGTCAQVGAQLITPSDAGRNRDEEA